MCNKIMGNLQTYDLLSLIVVENTKGDGALNNDKEFIAAMKF